MPFRSLWPILFLFIACNPVKDPGKVLYALDLYGAWALAVSEPDSVGHLYKLTENDDMELVKLYNEAGADLTNDFSVEYIYQVNDEYMLMVASYLSHSHSYLLRYTDGTFHEVDASFKPQTYTAGLWQADSSVKALRQANGGYRTINSLQALTLSLSDGKVSLLFLGNAPSSQFAVNNTGDLLFGNHLITSSTTIEIPFWNETACNVAATGDKGFWVSETKSASLAFHHLYVQDALLTDDTLAPLAKPTDNLICKGGYYFPEFSKTLFVYNAGFVVLSSSSRRYFPLNSIYMGRFDACCASDSFLFISGANQAGQPSFIRVNPSGETLTYSDVIASNLYEIHRFHVNSHGHGALEATRRSDNVPILAYFTPTVMKVKENYEGWKVRQVLAIR